MKPHRTTREEDVAADAALMDGPMSHRLHMLAEQLDPGERFVQGLEQTLRRQASRRAETPARPRVLARVHLAWARANAPSRYLTALATILVFVIGGLWASPEARAGAGQLACLIPGLGIRNCSPASLIMAAPVTAIRDGSTLTITRLLSADGETQVRAEISALPTPPPATLGGSARLTLVGADGRTNAPLRGTSQGFMVSGPEPTTTFGYSVEGVFPALTPGTRAVVVRVEGPAPLGSWQVSVPVVVLGEAALAQPGPGGLPLALHGITLQVTSVAADRSGLALRVTADADPTLGVVQEIRRSDYPGYLELRDERGRTYRERQPPPRASWRNAAGPLTGDVLLPPLADDARSGTLIVPFVKLRESGGTATLRVPIASRPAGELIPLDIPLAVNGYAFRVIGATLVDDRGPKILLKVDLGEWREGRKLIEPGWAEIDGQRVGEASRWGGDVNQAFEITVRPPTPVGDEVVITFHEPIVAVQGPWEIDVPLPKQR